jgi:O-acetyl-ADP-ribose deacetylase (regulator of RNase III)
VGPYYHEEAKNKSQVELFDCIVNLLTRSNDELFCQSISIPAISSGLFGYPVKDCADTIFEAIEMELGNKAEKNELNLKEVKIIIIDSSTHG